MACGVASLCASDLSFRSRGFPLSSATLAHRTRRAASGAGASSRQVTPSQRVGEGLGVRAMGVERAGVRGNGATFVSTPELSPGTVKWNESSGKAGGFPGGLKTAENSPPAMPSAGFTLIELLVVIALLMMLAAFLLPALGQSKSAVQRAKCLSNLRQLGLAARMYWDDNDDQAFAFRGPATNGGDLFWFGWLERGNEGKRAFDPTAGVLYPYFQGRGVDLCPAFNYQLAEFKLKATGAAYGYGYNLHLAALPGRPPVGISEVAQPSETILFADSAQVNTWQAPASESHPMLEEFYYVNATESTAHFRHKQTANGVFCDGHAAQEKPLPGSMDPLMPGQFVGRLRPEALRLR